MSRPFAAAAILLLSVVLPGCMGGGGRSSGTDPFEVSFEYSPAGPGTGETITFSASSNGSATQWAWDFGDGSTETGREVEHAYSNAGVYEVRLDAKDDQGRQDEASRFVQVGGGSGSGGLMVDFRYTIDGLEVDFEPVVLPSGTVVEQYFWDFGDGETSREPAPIHRYASKAEYAVEFRIATATDVGKAVRNVAVGVLSSDPSGLAGRPWTVIAIVDSGVNPYHEEFAAPQLREHPSTYIDGYPSEALPLDLSLEARSYSEAVRADDEAWKGVQKSKLYWIPGTKVIGAVSVEPRGERRILDDGDDGGHGTATASDAAGNTIGTCPECLIVVVEGLGDAPLAWALNQPWIDIVSNSWSATLCLPAPLCVADANLAPPAVVDASRTRQAVEEGKTVLFAAGNGHLNSFESPQVTYWSAYNGPDWVVTVGAADAQSGATVAGTGRPVDVVSFGLDWRAAAHNSKDSIKGFSGTSAATPVVAGAFGHVLQQAREALGDTHEGPAARGVTASGEAAKGLLSDGKLTRAELERALFATARAATGTPVGFPPLLPDSPAAFAYAGYGLIDAGTAAAAAEVVLGQRPMPTRANEDTWASVDSEIRQTIWGGYDPGDDDLRTAPPDPERSRSRWLQEILG